MGKYGHPRGTSLFPSQHFVTYFSHHIWHKIGKYNFPPKAEEALLILTSRKLVWYMHNILFLLNWINSNKPNLFWREELKDTVN